MLLNFKESHAAPILNQSSTLQKTNTNKLIISLLQSNWCHTLPLNPFLKQKLTYFKTSQTFPKNLNPVNPFYSNFTKDTIKLAGITSNMDYNPTTQLVKKPKTQIPLNIKKSLLHLFTSFIRINMSSQNELTTPHHTFQSFYLTHSKGGLTIITLSKLFQCWKNCYFLLYNLYYYKSNALTFSPSFFKTEVLALNWVFHKRFQFMWRYTRPFLVHKSNKITNHGDFVFRNLRHLGLSVGIVTDVLYHIKTIYYLRRTAFFSIGLVPTIYNAYTVDFALPTAYESIFTQIFFIRFLIRIKQDASFTEFNTLRQTWCVPLVSKQYIPTKIGTLDTAYSPEVI